jgi:hypothetical protein
MYFSSDKERLQLLGHSSFPATYPAKITENASPKVTLQVSASKGTGTSNRQFIIDCPDLRITEVGDAEYINDVVKVPLTLTALYDSTDATDLKLRVIRQTDADEADTAILEADLPSDFGPSTAASRKI